MQNLPRVVELCCDKPLSAKSICLSRAAFSLATKPRKPPRLSQEFFNVVFLDTFHAALYEKECPP
jgi:hypothetical protein